LGNGFSLAEGNTLLVGGGVGVAPLLYLGAVLKKRGQQPTFL
jgi:dihydroorotate dehydrogenase electron transfer subunit